VFTYFLDIFIIRFGFIISDNEPNEPFKFQHWWLFIRKGMSELFKKCAQAIINSILNISPDFLVLITKIACSVGAFLGEHGPSIFGTICFLKLFLVYTKIQLIEFLANFFCDFFSCWITLWGWLHRRFSPSAGDATTFKKSHHNREPKIARVCAAKAFKDVELPMGAGRAC